MYRKLHGDAYRDREVARKKHKRLGHGKQAAADIKMSYDHLHYSNLISRRVEPQKKALFSNTMNDYDRRRSDTTAENRTQREKVGDQADKHDGPLVKSLSPDLRIAVPS